MEQRSIAKWETFTQWFSGPDREDAYQSVEFTAEFTCRNRRMWVRGFYDGDGRYGLRMMPDSEGTWRYETTSNVPELNGQTGAFAGDLPVDKRAAAKWLTLLTVGLGAGIYGLVWLIWLLLGML